MKHLTKNIRQAIRDARKNGTVGMSVANLKQITSTKGLTCEPAEYHREFPLLAAKVAKSMRFNLYQA